MSFQPENLFKVDVARVEIFRELRVCDEVGESVVTVVLQELVQIAKLQAHFTARSFIRVPQLLHLCLEVFTRSRLEQESNCRLIRAKQQDQDL